ncbi:MAG TPA: M1 family aminopeptidase/hydrolase [Thermoanaerobaculia bacterium]|nr:M1 family aminopeptidase/hydrolase [Thermoanaerobaculia bacterium]
MFQRRLLFAFLSFFLLVAARQRAVRHPSQAWPLTAPPLDKFTVSQPAEVTTEHLDLDLTVDFATRRLHGNATLHIRNLTGTRTLRLDTTFLDVDRVTLDGDTPAQWALSVAFPLQALDVTIEPGTETVTIYYSTSPDPDGLYWQTPEQTYGGVQPFLYSLNEPTGARGWIPIQDTPSVRMTYNAVIHAPRGLMAVMSAENNPREPNDTGVYMFRMTYPIPAYLIAIAVGRFEFRELDERTGVYAEPEVVEDAAWEMQYLPAMLDAGEKIAGTFPFSRHDLLFMPPDFVAGGMEHPMINFISPSIITGIRPELPQPHSLIAHELAHSWAGDLVTLATWNDVWLNEGITSYLTVRFLEALQGADVANYYWWGDRRNFAAFAESGLDPEDTTLHLDVPYAGFGFGPAGYTKGELFMKTLEDRMGRQQFDQFLWRYFRTFSYRWVDDLNFLAFLRTEITPELEQQLQLQQWLYEPGLPSNITAPTSSALNDRAQERAFRFGTGTKISALAPETWSPLETTLFLDYASGLTSRMAEVDAALALSSRPSPPTAWLNASIRANYAPGLAAVDRVLARFGPRSRIVNLYRVLIETSAGRTRALQLFNQYREVYDAVTEDRVAQVLGVANAKRVVREAA